jgi:hypothetical protein
MGGAGTAFSAGNGLAGGLSAGLGAGLGGLGGGLGGGYDDIELDMTKVKASAVAKKPFERKTEEEKVDEKSKLTTKSNLKTTAQDFNRDGKEKKGIRFGSAVTYQVNEGDLGDED